jgi:hypothetical protein
MPDGMLILFVAFRRICLFSAICGTETLARNTRFCAKTRDGMALGLELHLQVLCVIL